MVVPAFRFSPIERLLAGRLAFTGTAWATVTSDNEEARYAAHASVIDGSSGDPISIPAVIRAVNAGGS